MNDTRPPIPPELRRRILVEAGHRCAIPTCRQTDVDVHHIEPWERVRKHEEHNLIALCPNCHRRAHKGEIDRKALRLYKRKLVYLSDRYSRYELVVLDYLQKNDAVLVFGDLSVYSLLEEGLIEVVDVHSEYGIYGNDGTPKTVRGDFTVRLTDAGRSFLRRWDDPEDESNTY